MLDAEPLAPQPAGPADESEVSDDGANRDAPAPVERPVAATADPAPLPDAAVEDLRAQGAEESEPAAAERQEDPIGPGAVASAPAPAARPDALDMTATALAVATAPRPASRPKSIRPRPAAAAGATAVAAPPRNAPTGRGVANVATVSDAIDLEKLSLLGVFGSQAGRRALLRLPSGEVMRVSKGTVVDGWVVSRIDATSMRITRGGDSQVLQIAR